MGLEEMSAHKSKPVMLKPLLGFGRSASTADPPHQKLIAGLLFAAEKQGGKET